MEYETDKDGKWLIQDKARLLVEPSAEWLAARDAENKAAELAEAERQVAQSVVEQATLDELATPLVNKFEEILLARGLEAMSLDERRRMADAAIYLSSRGKHGG